jgi:hypothetical protein
MGHFSNASPSLRLIPQSKEGYLGYGSATLMRGKSLTCRNTLFENLSVYDRRQIIFSISTLSGSSSFGHLLQSEHSTSDNPPPALPTPPAQDFDAHNSLFA